MRDGVKTEVVLSDTTAECMCGASPSLDQNPWRWARKHAEKTGHSPTVWVQHDIFRKETRHD